MSGQEYSLIHADGGWHFHLAFATSAFANALIMQSRGLRNRLVSSDNTTIGESSARGRITP
jgi:hypothetical protein